MQKKSYSGNLVFEHVMTMQKSATPEAGVTTFLGVASSTSVDRDTERISRSALVKGAKDLMKNSTVFLNHKHNEMPIAKVVNAYVESDNLYVEIVPSKADCVKDIVTMMNEGILKSMSVGGHVLNFSEDFDKSLNKSVKTIEDLELYEVSVVGVPANPDATILGSINKAFDVEKTRFATARNDDEATAKGDGGEEEEKHPIVPPKKKKAKDGELVDDEIYESARKKSLGDEMKLTKCATCGSVLNKEEEKEEEEDEESDSKKKKMKSAETDLEKNEPALTLGGQAETLARLETEMKSIMSAVEHAKKEMGKISGDTKGGPSMPSKPSGEKSEEDIDLQKKYDSMKSELVELEKKLAPAKGLAPSQGKFDSNVKQASVELPKSVKEFYSN